VVANKVRSQADIDFLKKELKDLELIGTIGFHQSVVDADLSGRPPFMASAEVVADISKVKQTLQQSFLKL